MPLTNHEFNFVLLYVKDAARSAEFYTNLLEKPIIEQSEGFAMLALTEKVMLGLWNADMVVPSTDSSNLGGGTELSMDVTDDEALAKCHAEWAKKGVMMLQDPVDMPFGRTFVASDPDGHRLRVASPKAM